MTAHAWAPGVRHGTPVFKCANRWCSITWWPDRREPRSQCKGTPVEEVASEFVRALMIGGAP
jgi:hypothetical protein